MDSKNMQRISLYLDRKTVKTVDLFIKQRGYRSRNEFFMDAVKNMVVDSMLKSENDLVSEKLTKAVTIYLMIMQKLSQKGCFAMQYNLKW